MLLFMFYSESKYNDYNENNQQRLHDKETETVIGFRFFIM